MTIPGKAVYVCFLCILFMVIRRVWKRYKALVDDLEVVEFSRDQDWINLTYSLAEKGRLTVAPNPMVGAILRDNHKGIILSQGYHVRPGQPHAEVLCYQQGQQKMGAEFAGYIRENSTLFVSLEPCCHENKRTPPCVNLLLTSPPHRIVVGSLDPNPQVGGKGVDLLRAAGIEVTVCDDGQNRVLNHAYFRAHGYE